MTDSTFPVPVLQAGIVLNQGVFGVITAIHLHDERELIDALDLIEQACAKMRAGLNTAGADARPRTTDGGSGQVGPSPRQRPPFGRRPR